MFKLATGISNNSIYPSSNIWLAEKCKTKQELMKAVMDWQTDLFETIKTDQGYLPEQSRPSNFHLNTFKKAS